MAALYKRGKVWYSKLVTNGDELRIPLSTDRRIATEKLAELVLARSADKYGHTRRNVTWAEFKKKFIESLEGAKAKPNTIANYRRAFRMLESAAPFMKVHEMTPMRLEDARGKWAARGLYVVNKDIACIKAAMRKAESWGYVPKQDWSTVKRIKEPKGRLHYFTVEEIRKLRKVCRGVFLTMLLLGARAGLRREEMFYLEWTDVDFERGRIHIAPKAHWTPKDFERRFIPMSKDLRAYLGELRHHDRRVLGPENKQPTVGSMTNYFRRLVRKAKLKGSLHTLRHTFGSHLAMAGVPLKTIKEMLGHSSIEMTEIYSHLSPDTIDSAILKLPDLD